MGGALAQANVCSYVKMMVTMASSLTLAEGIPSSLVLEHLKEH